MNSVNPLAHPAYRRLFAAQVTSLVGTGLTTVALALLAWDLAGGNAGVVLGTALAVKMVAYVFFSPVIGAFAHRLPRKGLLITLDVVRAAIVLMMPFVTSVWQVYLLIFLLNLASAGFTPTFSATIPDILPDERTYTRALSMSRLAYDLESLLSPLLAGIALLLVGYSTLFLFNSATFMVSALLVMMAAVPANRPVDRLGGLWRKLSFGVRAYLATPRLRGLLALYLGVACASAMIIVNTVVYVREVLGMDESGVALALAASGGGSMVVALLLPRILDHVPDRTMMLGGGLLLVAGLVLMGAGPAFGPMLAVWFLLGMGWSLVQTPAGRVVNRSASAPDRPAYFAAQFALSHAAWLLAYPLAGQLGAAIGIGQTALLFAAVVLLTTFAAALLWPAGDPVELVHEHEGESHQHLHTHDESHHDHDHPEGVDPGVAHSHPHQHAPVRHRHPFVIDDHHPSWPNR
ncbi:MAG: MFS transporter [Chromatiales bacterium]|nr:MFS transporter [Chromatiales bacterium]